MTAAPFQAATPCQKKFDSRLVVPLSDCKMGHSSGTVNVPFSVMRRGQITSGNGRSSGIPYAFIGPPRLRSAQYQVPRWITASAWTRPMDNVQGGLTKNTIMHTVVNPMDDQRIVVGDVVGVAKFGAPLGHQGVQPVYSFLDLGNLAAIRIAAN
jgi:hypothetical protein